MECLPESLPIRYNGTMKYPISILLLACLWLAGCSGSAGSSAETPSVLTPYTTRTAAVPTLPPAAPTLEPPPVSEQPTQITHVVKKGEDMGGIATLYGVKIKDLKAANSKIDPRMIPIGTVLIIPSGNPEQDAFQPTSIPTPAVVILTGPPVCYADPSGGAWCLIKVENNTETSVEDISVDLVLSGPGSESQMQPAFGLIDHLPAGQSMPLAVYFNPAPAQPWKIDLRLRTASPVINEEARYLHSQLDNAVVNRADDRLSARVSGVINLRAGQTDANVIQVVVAAYNAAGQPVGVRRWESPVGLESGSGLTYDFNVYSLGGPIDKVDVLLETRPK
jgi:LysM repeat protein